MRCRACDKLLNEREAAKKCDIRGDYLDLCTSCEHTSSEALAIALEDHGSNQLTLHKGNKGNPGNNT